jgi:hypothetical protein
VNSGFQGLRSKQTRNGFVFDFSKVNSSAMEQEEDSFEGQDNQNSSNDGTGIAASSTRSPAASKNSSSRLSSRDRDRKSPLLSSRRAVGISFDSVATGEPQPTNISSAVDIDFSSFSKVPGGENDGQQYVGQHQESSRRQLIIMVEVGSLDFGDVILIKLKFPA